MNNNIVETIVGGVVVLIAAVFLTFGYVSTSRQPSNASTYTALFDSIDGIIVNSEVKIGGVRIGVVSDINFDEYYKVVATLKINSKLNIPNDSAAEIKTSGIMGDKFIEIIPGSSDEFLKNNESFTYTKSSVNLESFIAKLVSSFLKKKAQ